MKKHLEATVPTQKSLEFLLGVLLGVLLGAFLGLLYGIDTLLYGLMYVFV